MNLAAVGVDDGQTSGLYSKQVNRAIEDALNDLGEIGAGVDVVCDLEKRLVDSRFSLLLGVDMGIAVADRDVLRKIANEVYLVLVPVILLAAVMQPHHPEELQIERDRHEQDRFAAHSLDHLLEDRWHIGRRGVRDGLRTVEVEAFLQPFEINSQLRAKQRRHFIARSGAIFVGYSKLILLRERHHVAAIDAHHLADLCDGGLKKMVEVNDGKGLRADAVEDGLARFVHL